MIAAPPPVARGGTLLVGVSDRTKKANRGGEEESNTPPPQPSLDDLTGTFTIGNKPRTTRISVPKTRTGCLTCKRRRIKCDETKPACKRCIKWKGTCEGYATNKKTALYVQRRGPAAKEGRLLLEPSDEFGIFSNQIQKNQFDRWLAFMSNSTLFPTSLLTKILPQLARAEPALRHAAFAIGAAAMDGETSQSLTQAPSLSQEQALAHYGRALRLIQSSKATKDNILWAMLSCILFITFECLQNNKKSALTHINHGSIMMDHYMKLSSPNRRPTPVEDELILNFQRLTMQSWTHNGEHPIADDGEIPWCCRGRKAPYAVDEMPTSLDNLVEARQWWEVVQHHIIYCCPMITGFQVRDVSVNHTGRQRPILSPERLPIFTNLAEKWHEMFAPLYKQAVLGDCGTEDSRQRYLQAVGLRISYLSIYTSLKSINYSSIKLVTAITPIFKEIMDLCRIMLTNQPATSRGAASISSMDITTTWALSLCSILCRDREIRAEATSLLRDYPRRDALWDSRVFLALAERAVLLEEEEDRLGDPGELPQQRWQRTFHRMVVFDGESVICRMLRRDPETMEWRMVEERLRIEDGSSP